MPRNPLHHPILPNLRESVAKNRSSKIAPVLEPEKVTVRWLVDHLPVKIWVAIVAAAGGIAVAAYALGSSVALAQRPSLSADVEKLITTRDKLKDDVRSLEDQRASLQSEIQALKIDREVEQMTPDQVKEELKKWTRPNDKKSGDQKNP